MAKPLYKGFSSFESQRNKTFQLNDIELVNLDLLNHIFTRKGERLMMGDFGTNIKDLTFEPLDNDTLELIQEELETVFNYDPRVTLIKIDIVPDYDNNSVIFISTLRYIELNLVDKFNLNIQFVDA